MSRIEPSSPFGDRGTDLFIRAGLWVGDGRYLDGNFLAEYNVSADEAFALLDRMKTIMTGYCWLPRWLQHAIMLIGVAAAPKRALMPETKIVAEFDSITPDDILRSAATTDLHAQTQATINKLRNPGG